MLKKLILFVFILSCSEFSFSQNPVQDTIYLMNGQVVGEKIIDTILGAVTIINPKKPSKKIHYEWDQLFMVRFADGNKRYYYRQDSALSNWFSRDEMWMYMKGENDARKGFKAKGAMVGAGIAGIIGGMTGTFWGPIAPYGFMALSGLPRVRIRHNTISNPAYVESDAYILGYERVARQRRKIKSVIGGTFGLVIGYGLYAMLHPYYPETINVGFSK
ncbi:hypothetical protein [Sediminibacterium sp.]|uniref:hypothetical protein n=1 Tax=Sediminibacterium sp. TaxID=1917865 RepID=UPI00273260A4|nr:hypothetical protein [Sediminibacterium sp.]MDP3567518.1 hypothetical protein [Sediminibacterium sp.]